MVLFCQSFGTDSTGEPMLRPTVRPEDAEPVRIAGLDKFTGPTPVRGVNLALDTDGLQVNLLTFDEGVRSRPHAHDFDQVLLFTEGPGVIAVGDGPDQLVEAGSFVMLPAHVPHMHGAPEGGRAAHISLMPKGHVNFFDCAIPDEWRRWREA
jgi:quercetin dioxygenase-like cupin family protein